MYMIAGNAAYSVSTALTRLLMSNSVFCSHWQEYQMFSSLRDVPTNIFHKHQNI
jgi:hypothetical protein